MPSPSERNRNNVKAGVFVSIALVLGLLVLSTLTNVAESFTHASDRYTVTFGVSSGVSNLKRGADVRVGGVKLGKVTKVSPVADPTQPFRDIRVDFKLDSRVKLYSDCIVIVSASLIGSDAWLDIPSVGTTGVDAGPDLRGTPSAGALTTLVGTESAADVQRIVKNARELSDFLPKIPGEYDSRVAPTLDNLKAASVDVKAVISDFREKRYANWADAVDKIMAWAVDETRHIDDLVAQANGMIGDARAVIAENREPLKAATANVQSITDRVNTQTIDKVHALLDSGQAGLDQAVELLEDLRVDYATWATDIGEALGNANLATQQLKLAAIETRRSPWKLLYRPSATELDHELLYEAARSFAVAAGDLKAASASVQRVLDEHGEDLAGNEEAYRRLQKNLLNSLANYETAQQQLLDVLMSDKAK